MIASVRDDGFACADGAAARRRARLAEEKRDDSGSGARGPGGALLLQVVMQACFYFIRIHCIVCIDGRAVPFAAHMPTGNDLSRRADKHDSSDSNDGLAALFLDLCVHLHCVDVFCAF